MCYDLANRLSHYLYFFSFSFLIGLTTTRWSVGKYHVVMLYKSLGKLSDILHLNDVNNQLER